MPFVANHIVDIVDSTTPRGAFAAWPSSTSRAWWIEQAILYLDAYERVGGTSRFARPDSDSTFP